MNPNLNKLYSSLDPEWLQAGFPTASAIYPMIRNFIISQVGDRGKILVANSGNHLELDAFGSGFPNLTFSVYQAEDCVDPAPNNFSQSNLNLFEMEKLTDLDSDPRIYDAAICSFLIHFLNDDDTKLEVLKNISNRLKSGSPFILVTCTGDRSEPEFERQLKAWAVNLEENSKIDSTLLNIEQELENVRNLPLITQGRLSELMSAAGFHQSSLFYATYFCRGWVSLKK